jgi:hypothetical protein
MARTLEEILAELPPERRAKIEAAAADLIELHKLRHKTGKTQAEVAATMGVGQDAVSRLERRGDTWYALDDTGATLAEAPVESPWAAADSPSRLTAPPCLCPTTS